MHVISIAIQKGGTGKTTLAVNLAAGLTLHDKRVLLIDLDIQSNATNWTLPNRDMEAVDSADVILYDDVSIEDAAQRSPMGFDVVACSEDMGEALRYMFNREEDLGIGLLRRKIRELSSRSSKPPYDYVLIDTPPSKGPLPVSALAASSGVIIPITMESMAIEGLGQFLDTIREVRESGANPNLETIGIVPNILDLRRNSTKEGLKVLEQQFGDLLFPSGINQRTHITEASTFQESVFEYEPESYGSKAYGILTDEVLRRTNK